MSNRQINLVLFFTRGISLREWERSGMLERELSLYRRLLLRGVNVTFVTYGDARDIGYGKLMPGIRILCNRWGLKDKTYEALIPLLHGLSLYNAHIIKSNQTDGADVALRAAQVWRKSFVARCGYMLSEFTRQGRGESSREFMRALEIEEKVFSGADRIIVTTPMMESDVVSRFPAARCTVIPNYVDTDLFMPAPPAKKDIDVLFVGRLSPQKNVPSLIRALRSLPVKAAVVSDGELRSSLEQEAADIAGRVSWLGNVDHRELPSIMNRSRLFVLPSLYEGHPKTLIEAMSCGLPVVGSNVTGIREIIRHGETGWLCETDPESIRASLETLLSQPDLCTRLGRNARDYAAENFSLEKIVRRESALYEDILSP